MDTVCFEGSQVLLNMSGQYAHTGPLDALCLGLMKLKDHHWYLLDSRNPRICNNQMQLAQGHSASPLIFSLCYMHLITESHSYILVSRWSWSLQPVPMVFSHPATTANISLALLCHHMQLTLVVFFLYQLVHSLMHTHTHCLRAIQMFLIEI